MREVLSYVGLLDSLQIDCSSETIDFLEVTSLLHEAGFHMAQFTASRDGTSEACFFREYEDQAKLVYIAETSLSGSAVILIEPTPKRVLDSLETLAVEGASPFPTPKALQTALRNLDPNRLELGLGELAEYSDLEGKIRKLTPSLPSSLWVGLVERVRVQVATALAKTGSLSWDPGKPVQGGSLPAPVVCIAALVPFDANAVTVAMREETMPTRRFLWPDSVWPELAPLKELLCSEDGLLRLATWAERKAPDRLRIPLEEARRWAERTAPKES